MLRAIPKPQARSTMRQLQANRMAYPFLAPPDSSPHLARRPWDASCRSPAARPPRRRCCAGSGCTPDHLQGPAAARRSCARGSSRPCSCSPLRCAPAPVVPHRSTQPYNKQNHKTNKTKQQTKQKKKQTNTKKKKTKKKKNQKKGKTKKKRNTKKEKRKRGKRGKKKKEI